MDRNHVDHERRRAARRAVAADEPLARARLRTGGHLTLLDASSLGILVETRERLLPGRHLDVHIVTSNGRQLVRAKVVRSYVHRLTAETICYRAALGFDQPADVRADGYVLPPVLASLANSQGTPYPERASSTDIVFTDRPAE